MTIMTLELSSSSMVNDSGIYTQPITNLPIGKRVRIITISSQTSITTALIVFPFIYWNSNLIQNNSYDSFNNSYSNTLQVINHTTRVINGAITTFNTDTITGNFETVIPESISISKRMTVNKTLLNENQPFYIKIVMETIDD